MEAKRIRELLANWNPLTDVFDATDLEWEEIASAREDYMVQFEASFDTEATLRFMLSDKE